ncbi:MAG: VWA domain-containing protein [Pyrinomonadaceae bacterium]
MKRIAVILVAFAALSAGVLAQSNRSVRPRVVPTATPTPYPSTGAAPQLGGQTDRSNTTSNGGPPVLRRRDGADAPAVAAPTPPVGTPVDDDDEVIRVDTNLVTMPVSVLDRDGRFVSGLRQQDFKIFENGVEQRIEQFQTVEQPFTVILMIDVSPSTQWQIEDIQNAAITFVDQLRAEDRVMVIAFDEKVHVLARPTNDRYQLQRAIRRARFGDGTSLYEAVDHVIQRELRYIQGRKAVVLFTDGVDTTSRRADFGSTIAESEESEALFYTIRYDTSREMMAQGGGGYPSPYPQQRRRITIADILAGVINAGQLPGGGGRAGSSSEEYETGRRYLETLSRNSGGRGFEADSLTNLDAAFSGIAEELRRQYSIGYYPEKAGQPGERRRISVRVNRPGLVVRSKNSYVVGQGSQQAGK